MVVSSLIATVAYQVAISPPGGVLQADETVDDEGNPLEHPRKAGTAVMAYKQGIDTSVNLLYISKTYVAGQRLGPSGVLHNVTQTSVLAWLGLMGVVFIGNVVRVNLWVLREYVFVKAKKQNSSTDKVDNDNEDV
ncbi:hypothetical protein V6N13_058019 [Hibiscus sabdariffa]|uniref:PGG domain-containing protein n=1 Tax=Hibiscus sabdariffa TaxID=183260 RepID=A0ABR2GIF5_9ROSI